MVLSQKRMNVRDGSFWEKTAPWYDRFMRRDRHLYDAVCDGVRPYLTPSWHVAEVGCGSGQLSFPLAPLVADWEASDRSAAMIRQARLHRRGKTLHFSVLDATRLPYATESFDAVVVANVLHMMPQPQNALGEVHRVLKDGGLLFAPTFIRGKTTVRKRFLQALGFEVLHPWDEPEFLKFLQSHGFVVRESRVLQGSVSPLCFVVLSKEGK
jgi:ubiquinone/menaquinone biosynthesis C-methylase UbiE